MAEQDARAVRVGLLQQAVQLLRGDARGAYVVYADQLQSVGQRQDFIVQAADTGLAEKLCRPVIPYIILVIAEYAKGAVFGLKTGQGLGLFLALHAVFKQISQNKQRVRLMFF